MKRSMRLRIFTTAAMVMVALLAINARLALTATAAFGAAYVLITALSRRRLQHNSRRVADGYSQLVKALQDGTIKGAGLDVFADEPHVPASLLTMDHVVPLGRRDG